MRRIQNKHTLRCSKCRKVGHNKRTCGMEKALNKIQKPATVKAPTTHQTVSSDTGRWSNTTSNSSGYSYEELTTLWLLTDGKYGQSSFKGKVWAKNIDWGPRTNLNLVDFVAHVNNGAPETSFGVWKEFFNDFSVSAKSQFLYLYTTPTTPESSETENLRLPDVLYDVFVEDPSPKVRGTLAITYLLPSRAQQMLSEDEDEGVIMNLSQNRSLSSHVFRKVAHKVITIAEKRYQNYETEEEKTLKLDGRVVIALKSIRENPNLTPELVVHYQHPPISDLVSVQPHP